MMFKPTDFPTDSLYKFLATVGTVLVLLGIGYPLYQIDALEEEAVDLVAMKESGLAKIGAVEPELGRLGTGKSTPEDLAKVQAHVATLRAVEVEVGRFKAKMKLHAQVARRNLWICAGAAFFGLLTANFGFFLWYRRVQAPADASALQALKAAQAMPKSTPIRGLGRNSRRR